MGAPFFILVQVLVCCTGCCTAGVLKKWTAFEQLVLAVSPGGFLLPLFPRSKAARQFETYSDVFLDEISLARVQHT